MRMMNKILLITIVALSLGSCRKDNASGGGFQSYSIPTTYNFSPVNYSGQTYRISMLTEMTTLMKTGNTQGTIVNAQTLKDMFSNTGSPFSDTALNSSSKQLENKCFSLEVNTFKAYMDSLEMVSNSVVNGSNGVAGVVVSTSNPSKKYLLNANGVEYTQIIEKGLMGAVLYYQAMETYFCLTCSEGVGNTVDNQTSDPVDGTVMEHHWDEGFGYFSVPIDFPANLTGIQYWGKYCNTVDPLLNTNEIMMNALLKGRAAISNKDYTTRDQQLTIVRETWDMICAGVVIHYLNETLNNLTDDALRNHSLSECVAFIGCFKYNVDKKITDTEISNVLSMIGTNFYNVTTVNLNNAKNTISTIYGLDAVKDNL